ncbi:hypothetical protein ACWD3K_31295 [Streptomyces sp. NPDC002778]
MPHQSDPTAPAPLPVVRAVAFAAVGTVLGVSAHHLVAEGPAPWRQSASAALVLFAVGLIGTRRPRSLATVVVTCGTAQIGLHRWLMTEHPAAAPPSSATLPGHLHHSPGAHPAWPQRMHDSLAMTAVHAAAAVLVAVLLHRADTVCWSVARGLTTAVDAARARMAAIRALLSDRPAPTVHTGLSALLWWEAPPPEEAVLVGVVVRRGPPQAGLALAN